MLSTWRKLAQQTFATGLARDGLSLTDFHRPQRDSVLNLEGFAEAVVIAKAFRRSLAPSTPRVAAKEPECALDRNAGSHK
jgi:hypothetical protein